MGLVFLIQDIVAVNDVAVTVVDAVVSMHQRFLQKYKYRLANHHIGIAQCSATACTKSDAVPLNLIVIL